MAAATPTPRPSRKVRRTRAALAIEVPTGVGQLSTAAAHKIKDAPPRRMERQKWQEEAYGHVDFIGEVGYVTGKIADVVARANIRIVERDLETGAVVVPEKDDDGNDIIVGDRAVAERALLALRGPSGDYKSIVRSIAEADFIAGEGHLVGCPIDKLEKARGTRRKKSASGQIAWEFLSIMEVVEDRTTGKKTRKRYAKQAGTVDGEEELDGDTYVARYHRRDPRHSGDATSSLRKVAAACREVVLLTQLIDATIKSHIPAGILLVADELSLPVGSEDETVDDDEEVDPLLEVLTEHLSAPIEDRQSAASLVPLLLNAPAEVLDSALRLVKLDAERMDPERIINLRDNALERIATGVDLPPETMTGFGQLTHWTGATVSKDFIENHVIPTGDRIVQFLTVAYLRRILMDAEGWDEEKAERFEFQFDASALLTRADAAASADRLWSDLILSDDSRLRAHGFDPEKDKPKDEERFRRYVQAIALAASVTNKPFLAALGLDKDTLVEMGMDPDAADAMLSPAPPPADGDEGPDEDPPEAGEPGIDEDTEGQLPGGPEAPVSTGPEDLAVVQERIRGAASWWLMSTTEKAAGLVIQRVPNDSLDTRDRLRSLTKLEVLPAIPAADWKRMNVKPGKLVQRPWVRVVGLTVSWLRRSFEAGGMPRFDADEAAHRVASEIEGKLNELYLAGFRAPLKADDDGLFFPAEFVDEVVARHLELAQA